MGSFMSMFKSIFAPEDEFDEDELEEMEQEVEQVNRTLVHQSQSMPTSVPKVVSLNQSKNQPNRMEILNFTMQSYEMTGEICGYVKAKKPIIVNMEKLAAHEMQRAVDYLTGACFALNGTVEKVTDNIFIFAPENVSINPDKVKPKSIFPPTI